MNKTILILAILAASAAASAALAADPSYAVTRRLDLGAPSRWDYTAIDQVRQRLYVTRGDRVDVLALPAGTPVGSIASTQGVHGVAFAQDLRIGFTSNGKSNTVTVFELESLKPIAEIAVKGQNPDAILYVPEAGKVYVFNGKTASYDVIDAKTLQLIASGATTGRPESAVSDGQGRVYFNIEDHPGINVIDTASDKVVATWTLAGCTEPTGLAIDPINARLFSTCQNRIMAVTDSRTGKRVTQFAIGEHPDVAVFDASSKTVLSSDGGGQGTLSITHQDGPDHYTALPNMATVKGAKTMAMDSVTKTVYLPSVVADKFVVLVAEHAK